MLIAARAAAVWFEDKAVVGLVNHMLRQVMDPAWDVVVLGWEPVTLCDD